MKKLLQINSGVGVGSTGKIVESLGRIAQANGFESYIGYGRKALESESLLIPIGNKKSIYSHFFFSRIFGSHGLHSCNATMRFLKEIETLDPDIIHLHNIHGYYLNLQQLFQFLAKSGKPVVWTLHDCWAFTGHCAYFSALGCEKWKTQCHNCPCYHNYPKSFVDRSFKNYILKKELFSSLKNLSIVPVSEWLGSLVKTSFLGDKPIIPIHNGIDLDIFSPASEESTNEVRKKYGLTKKHLLLGAATAWSESKGLLKYKALSSKIGDDTEICLVGITQKQAKNFPENIKTIARTDNQKELSLLYSAADIVLNLSIQESFGLTTVEGLACGTPGIVLNTTASPELVTKQTGIVADANNMDSVVGAIKEILYRGKSYYSNACRNRAEEHFDQNIQWKKYIDLYNSLLNNP